MTNKQAIDVLQDMVLDYGYASHKAEVEEAVELAITALQAQDVDAISRQAVLWMLTNLSYTQCKTQGEAEVIGLAKTMLIAMPSAQEVNNSNQEVNNSTATQPNGIESQASYRQVTGKLDVTDCISRQDAIDAFKPYADYESNRTNTDWVRRIELVLNDLPSAQPVAKDTNVLNSDCISRQAAIDATWKDPSYTDPLNVLTEVRDRIKALPSAQPEPCEHVVSAVAVEEMLKNLLPERGMWEIEGDDAKTAICETIHDALDGLWRLPFVKPDSKELSSTHKGLDTISRQAAIDVVDNYMDKCIELHYLPTSDGIKRLISVLPSAQPEIIRCRDCRWCEERYDSLDKTPYLMCRIWDSETYHNGFCHEAERRTDEPDKQTDR